MSLDISSDRVCYVHCNLCNTILAQTSLPFHDLQNFSHMQDNGRDFGSSSKNSRFLPFESVENNQPRMLPIRQPEKRQRVPSAYNRFIKEEIQRIKASNPDISHREAFSTAAKNWAHFPHIHFGLNIEGSKQATRNC